jgi:hypothetical protein
VFLNSCKLHAKRLMPDKTRYLRLVWPKHHLPMSALSTMHANVANNPTPAEQHTKKEPTLPALFHL